MNSKPLCPNCKKPSDIGAAKQWRPFCCERCKLVDLGEWMNEGRRIPAEEDASGKEMTDDGFVKH